MQCPKTPGLFETVVLSATHCSTPLVCNIKNQIQKPYLAFQILKNDWLTYSEKAELNKRITLVSRDTLITQYNLWYCNMYDACWSHGWCLLIPCMMLVDHMDDACWSHEWHFMMLNDALRRFMTLYDTLWRFIMLYDASWRFMTLHDPCCNTFDDIMNDLMMFCCFGHSLTHSLTDGQR